MSHYDFTMMVDDSLNLLQRHHQMQHSMLATLVVPKEQA